MFSPFPLRNGVADPFPDVLRRLPVEVGHKKKGVCPLPPCCRPESIGFLDTRSNTPIQSTDKTVLSGWRSVKAWTACPTHSVPERVDKAYWNGPVACSNDTGICWATALDTALLNVSPTTMPLTPPVGLRKAVIRPRGIPSTTTTRTSSQTNSSATCHNISLSRALFKTTFKCLVVI